MTGTGRAGLVAAILLVAAQAAMGHHFWVVNEDGTYTVARGAVPDRLDPYDPACVINAAAYARNGSPIELIRHDGDQSVSFDAGDQVAVFAVRADWGHRVLTTHGKKFMTRQQAEEAGLHVLNSFFSTHCAKVLFDTCSRATEPVGMELEMVPLSDPVHSVPGDELGIRLLFRGEPLGQTAIVTQTGSSVPTDADGVARVGVPGDGLQLLMATHQAPGEQAAELDYHKFMAFLAFETR